MRPLSALAEQRGNRGDGVQRKLEGTAASPSPIRSRRRPPRVRGKQLVHQRALAAGLYDVECVEEPVVENLRLVDVVGAEQVLRATSDVGDFE